ncbi:HD domain-containing protein [bacterium]|uniref:HD/PDEase domain-containing protein n=1 Tax=candidate division WWE3 bacterium CG_4_9_14_3_um_filter_39_7 TaxID=1975080 RepID=A0A2M7WZN4_UNCKA|nr:HD domain-containing protein [bacterium]PJA39081.1 MAG: hypothetical protein CO179_05925 [candidate division WWE3 bacterium CG_4_9_14_3_um_filter_39_7]
MKKELFVSDIKSSIGFVGETSLLVVEKDEKQTKNGKPYLILKLRDSSGDISAKVWSDALGSVGDVGVGDVSLVTFEVGEYQNKADLTVLKMTKLTEYDEEDFRLKRDDIDFRKLESDLSKWVDGVRDFSLQKLLRSFFDDKDFYKLYSTYPAGERTHHTYRHGLLQHSIEVVTIAEGMFELHPDMHRDLIITGGLLHDIGKLYEYSQDDLGVIGWTVEGRMYGHVVLSWLEIQKRISSEMSMDITNRLANLILSHQGKLEYGSPVVPRTRESLVLSLADKASMDLDIARSMYKEAVEGEDFTEYNRYLGTDLYIG